MLNKILLFIALGVFAGLTPIQAQTPAAAPSAPARVKGKIVAVRVQGHVQAISKLDGTTRELHENDAVTEQTQINTAVGASVILSFSNGATVNVAANTVLDIEQFEQDPFAGDIKISDMKAEPTTSTTRLNLTRGELVGKVVHLNIDKGSEFTIQTPVGAAGIRGTTFMITFTPGTDGKAFFTVTTADGRVVFTGTTAGPVSVPAGKSVTATFDYTPPAPGSTTPTTPATTTPVTITSTDTTPDVAAQVQAVAQTIVTATQNAVATGGTGTGTGTGGTTTPSTPPPSTTPPAPTQPQSTTTPLAGATGS